MRTGSTGFTVIELLIIVVVLGLVAAFVYPKYAHYATRSDVAKIVALASRDEHVLADYYTRKGLLPADRAAAEAAGLQLTEAGDSPMLSRDVGYQYQPNDKENLGLVRLHYTLVGIDGDVDGKTLTMVGDVTDNGLRWQCRAPKIDDADVPAACASASSR